MKDDLMLHELNIGDGKLDMKLGGKAAQMFMVMLINLFEQNGGKSFLTTTMEGLGKRYSIEIINLDGNDSPAEKLQRLEAQNRELATALQDMTEWSKKLYPGVELLGLEMSIDKAEKILEKAKAVE